MSWTRYTWHDEPSVMSGIHSGVQTRISDLNFVIFDAVNCHSKVLNFFDAVQAVLIIIIFFCW